VQLAGRRTSRVTSRTKIYIDIDDVLCDTGKAFVNLLQQDFGKTILFEQIVDYDLGASFCLDPQDLVRFMHRAHEPEVLLAMQPMDGAREAVSTWKRAGCEIHLLTGRPPATRETSLRWLAAVEIPFDHLIFVDKYGRYAPVVGESEVMTLDDLSKCTFDLAVEDAPKMAQFLAKDVADTVLLFDRPWNRALNPAETARGDRINRCRTWAEIAALYPTGERAACDSIESSTGS
jgi:uncharacterized HAD superfamily protein